MRDLVQCGYRRRSGALCVETAAHVEDGQLIIKLRHRGETHFFRVPLPATDVYDKRDDGRESRHAG